MKEMKRKFELTFLKMLSEQSYYNLMENIYIIGSKNRYDWPMEFKTQLERGKRVLHDFI